MRFNFEEEVKKEKRTKVLKAILRWAIEIAAVILLAFLLVHFCILRSSMIGSSMEDTLNNGQDILINKASYLVLSPKRNDIIAFRQITQQDADEDYLINVRRVIGLPGEKLQIKDGSIYIDGEKQSEKYDMVKMQSGGQADSVITLGDGEYFVLGDNRNDSEDSRFRSFGMVKKENIIGKVIFKGNPFSLIGGPTKKENK